MYLYLFNQFLVQAKVVYRFFADKLNLDNKVQMSLAKGLTYLAQHASCGWKTEISPERRTTKHCIHI